DHVRARAVFPTRRSSDLDCRVDGLRDQGVGTDGGGQRAAREHLDGCRYSLACRNGAVCGDRGHPVELATRCAPEDLGEELALRRSEEHTSEPSHLVISYA